MSAQKSGRKQYSWPIRVIALLLLFQSVSLLVLTAGNFYLQLVRIPDLDSWFDQVESELDLELDQLSLETTRVLEAFTCIVMFSFSIVLALVAAVGFFFLLRFGWVLAMLTQVINLMVSLILYIEFKSVVITPVPWILYVIMGYSIFLVLYLNTADVRTAFFADKVERRSAVRRVADL
ncbi:MAG: hypothetical protein JW900_07655 [Anaerolineae bacterium]|nr:hypothetical protein [Anaerolineae bacterium]